jgi:hypothetical protein
MGKSTSLTLLGKLHLVTGDVHAGNELLMTQLAVRWGLAGRGEESRLPIVLKIETVGCELRLPMVWEPII